MASLKLWLLGPPRIEDETGPVEIQRRKAVALLVYLAVKGESQPRDSLATLLWPDNSQSEARMALRRDLSALNKALDRAWLEIDREKVGLERKPGLWLDVAQFEDLLAVCRTHGHPAAEVCPLCLPLLSEAVDLYRADFLTGFTLRDCPEFDEWQFFQAESLRQALASALERLAQGYSLQNEANIAISYARRRLALDPLHEPSHRTLMALYGQAGQQAAALRQYQECVRLLAEELGTPPQAETTVLYERLRYGPERDRSLIAQRFSLEAPEKNLLGQGGMGQVYRGKDAQTGEVVAIKLLKPELVASQPELLERFIREGEALRRLNHPHIVKLLAASEQGGRHYLVMEYVAGGSLRDLLQSQGPLPVEQVLEIGLDLADALTRAHRLNIIHRDLKPANVLLAEDGTPRLTDFGVARLADTPQLTQTGLVIGTLDYLSPEACDGAPLDKGADIWAFGVLLYEMLAGRRPFQEATTTATLTAILMDPVPDLAQFRAGIPDALADLVYRMLEKEPQQRIPSMRLVGAELEALLESRSPRAGQLSLQPPRSPEPQVYPFEAITPTTAPASKHNFPLQPTPLVGRVTEQAELAQRLAESEQRLITILGPGGMGKSRLALAVAEAHLTHFADGTFFVPLAPLDSPEAMVPAVAEAVNFAFYEGGTPQQQLLDCLREKTMLLILDNFEHLLAGAPFVAEMLKVAPGLKIVVTSRARLHLQVEHLFSLSGVSYPEPETLEDVADYDAVKLFRQSARRVQPGFELTPDNREGVIQICRLVQGMPLGIVLAAAWVAMLTPAEIAAEIKQSLDFLVTDLQDVPQRQQSLRALFDHSWYLLTEAEQSVFQQLTIFRGGFTREAAQAVTGASLRSLMSLVNQSLLYRAPTGRYEIHELLRQYGAEILAQSPALEAAAREQHSRYYLGFLTAREQLLTGKAQQQALEEISPEISNVRLGWLWAVEQNDMAAIGQSLVSLYHFFQVRSLYHEGQELFSQAMTHLQPASSSEAQSQLEILQARLSARRGALFYYLADYETANQQLQASLDRLDSPNEQAFALIILGQIARMQGKRSLAEQLLRQSLELSREIGDLSANAKALRALADVASTHGDYLEAKRLAVESLALNRRLSPPDQVARALHALAWPTHCLGAYSEAERYWQESLAICQAIGNQFGIGDALNMLGWATYSRGDSELSEAAVYHQKALMIFRYIGRRWNMAMCLGGLALIANETGEFEQAAQHSREGLAITEETGILSLMAYNLTCLGTATCGLGDFQAGREYFIKSLSLTWEAQVMDHITIALFYWAVSLVRESDLAEEPASLKLQRKERAVELLAFVIGHPACLQPIKDRAASLQARLEAELPPEVVATAKAWAKSQTLDEVVAEILQASQGMNWKEFFPVD